MGERFTLSLRAYTWVAYAALLTLVLIVLSGAGVRLTGSGLGCPSWPDCRGTFLPELSSHVWIEYGNRLFSSVVGIACITAGVLAFRVRPRRPDLVRPALVLAGGVVAQGLLGGLTVALDLSWPVVIAHYLLSMTLLLAAAILVWRVRGGVGRGGDRWVTLATRVLVIYGGLVIIAGTFATAAGPHAGGAGTGDVVERLDAFGAGTLKTLIHLHGHMATAMGVAAVGLWAFARARGVRGTLMGMLTAVCLLIAAQGIVGLIQYHNALPAGLVWVHASLPAVLWVSLVWSWLAAAPARDPAPAPQPAARPRPGALTRLVRPAAVLGVVLARGVLRLALVVAAGARAEQQVHQEDRAGGPHAHAPAVPADAGIGREQDQPADTKSASGSL